MDIFDYGRQVYRLLHSIPEGSGQEYKTSQTISKLVEAIGGYTLVHNGKEGLVYSNCHPQTYIFDLAFRAEMDAIILPNNDAFHGCGHDLHMTSLIQLMAFLKIFPSSRKILFVFQSSEEAGNGAKNMVNTLNHKGVRVNKIIGLHNAPDILVEDLAIKKNETLSNNFTNRLTIQFYEEERYDYHMPKNPLSNWSEIYSKITTLYNHLSGVLFRIGEFRSNGQTGIQADELSFSLSIRSNELPLKSLYELFDELVVEIQDLNYVKHLFVENINYHWRIYNSPKIYEIIKNNRLFNTLEIPDSFTSDDFCYYEGIAQEIFYLFLGSFENAVVSKTHTKIFRPNLDFLNNSLKLYKFLLEEM
ncbi:M20/M25/M40 family metallo-hydrolase [Streptococcus sobrinus]|uniref:N-acyl-L-amino acid amidohydrolase n=1 Tax=Streptococcus sobrinus TaxID=1310 RepID=A0ABN5LHE6_9STRE|nr:M20/M25/M40 family metallo-hydrolase [Streptococcus sobrinus]AWN18396.1 N-acyl-L-amino acid amidohydrolase [Streptococcus sobrinus]AWN20311.1 N-acyl-L-amino acid amidohydrolase [Streptococcus sobrinus]